MDYASFLHDRLSGCRICHQIACLAAALVLAAQFWGVSGALANRGADVCLSRTTVEEQRAHAVDKPCMAEILAGDASGEQPLPLHLRGNCQGGRGQAMIASRDQVAQAAAEQSWPTCSPMIGS